MGSPLKISPDDLVAMDEMAPPQRLRIELAYARAENTLFGERIYRTDAKLWLHARLAAVVLTAANAAYAQGFRLVLYDGLRTTSAQAKMLETARVKANPHWLEEPRLLSPPGKGAHPRGMAIDVSLETLEGALLDMGTDFDFLAADPSPAHNPAHRQYVHLSPEAAQNRALLDGFMVEAAKECGEALMLLAQEWWDFRLPPDITEGFAPLADDDLPPEMRLL